MIRANDAAADAPEQQQAPRAADSEPEEGRGGLFGSGLRLPPIRWGGTLTTDLRYIQIDKQHAFQRMENATLRLGSYIWQPWLAQVNGTLTLLTSNDRVSGDPQGNVQRFDNKSSTASGGGSLALFPASRFPFNAYFDLADSRASGEAALADYTSTRMGVRQSYQPLDGLSSYSANYDRSVLKSPSFGRDVVNAYGASANRQFGLHSVNLSGSRTTNERGGGDGSVLNRVTGTHAYRPDSTLSIESFANVSSAGFRLTNNGVPNTNDSRFVQLNTFATWRPDQEELPLHVTGGGRYFQSTVESEGQSSTSQVWSANVAANYRFRPDLNLYANGSVTQATNDTLTSQSIGATYTPLPIKLGSFTWSWNVSLSLANQTSTEFGSQQHLAGQVGHTIMRPYALGESANLTVSASQSFSNSLDTIGMRSQTLSHTANAALRFSPTPNSNAYFSLIGADSHTSGSFESSFQLVNLQANGQVQLSRYSNAQLNLTVQGTRQSTPDQPANGFAFTTSGNVNYQHVRLLDVPRLRYTATYGINETQYKSRLQGDVEAPRDIVNQSLEQRLDYNIGRIEMRLTARFASIEGQRTAHVMFRVSRQFGAF